MNWWQVVLVVIAAIALVAIIRNLRKQSAQAAEQRQVDEFRQLQAKAAAADRAEQAALAAASIRTVEPDAAERGRGFLQDAADNAAGLQYERAVSAMKEAASELEQARHDADRAAQRLAARADEAMTSIQLAASAHGGAVPGDGSAECPAEYPVKGDLQTMRYSVSGQDAYGRMIPEVCFQSVAAAEAAGFTEHGEEIDSRGNVEVEDMVAAEVVADPGGESLESVAAEAILIRDGDDAAGSDVVRAAIAAADAGGVPPGAVRGDGSRDCPSAYPIKGNQSSMLFHVPESATYAATIPEFCFSSEHSARAAGFLATPY